MINHSNEPQKTPDSELMAEIADGIINPLYLSHDSEFTPSVGSQVRTSVGE